MPKNNFVPAIALFTSFALVTQCDRCRTSESKAEFHKKYGCYGCNYCQHYDDYDDDAYDCECDCLYSRISVIPVIPESENYEGRRLTSIPVENGKLIDPKEMKYEFVVEKPMLEEEYTSELDEKENYFYIDMGAELAYTETLDISILEKWLKSEHYLNNVKTAETYLLVFNNKIREIITHNKSIAITQPEQKENPHVSRRKKKNQQME